MTIQRFTITKEIKHVRAQSTQNLVQIIIRDVERRSRETADLATLLQRDSGQSPDHKHLSCILEEKLALISTTNVV